MFNAQTLIVLLPVVVVFFIVVLVALFVMARVSSPWLRAYLSGVPLSVFQIIGMRLRRTDVQAVLGALVEPHHPPRNLQTWHCHRRHGRILGN